MADAFIIAAWFDRERWVRWNVATNWCPSVRKICRFGWFEGYDVECSYQVGWVGMLLHGVTTHRADMNLKGPTVTVMVGPFQDPADILFLRSLHDLAQVLIRICCGGPGEVLSRRFLHEDLADAMYMRSFYESYSGMLSGASYIKIL